MPVKKTTKKATSKKKATVKKTSTKKSSTVKKKAVATKKTVTKKAPAKKKAVTKKTTKKTTAKKAVTKKVAAKKTAFKKTGVKKTVTTKTKPQSKAMKVNAAAGPLGFTPYVEKSGEEYMGAGHVEHFNNILMLWKRQLMEEVDSTVGHMKEDDNVYADPVDRASMEADFNLELRTRDRERKLIRKIESALDDLDRGEYGYCEDCGADIGIRRLEARPTATKCIDCKTFQEIKEKQGA